MTNRELLCDLGYEDSVVFENPDYDSAIMGVSLDGNVIYDYDKMLACLAVEDGCHLKRLRILLTIIPCEHCLMLVMAHQLLCIKFKNVGR